MTEPRLTLTQAQTLRDALTRLQYAQEFSDAGDCESWFSPTSAPSRLFFFSPQPDGILINYSDSTQCKDVTFEEAMRFAQAGVET